MPLGDDLLSIQVIPSTTSLSRFASAHCWRLCQILSSALTGYMVRLCVPFVHRAMQVSRGLVPFLDFATTRIACS